MKIYKQIFYHLLVLSLFLMSFIGVYAQNTGTTGHTINNPLTGNSDLVTFFNTILDKIIIPIGAILALLLLIYSGYLFITAGGNEDQIKTAKTNILYVVIGAAIILGAKAIAAGIQATVQSLH